MPIQLTYPGVYVQGTAPRSDNPTLANMVDAIDEIGAETARRMIVAAFERLSDEELSDAFTASGGEPGNPIADLLAVAAEERGVEL